VTAGAALVAPALAAVVVAAAPTWRAHAPLPVPRTEVAGAFAGGRIVVTGGYLTDGSSSARTDIYAPASGSWQRGPDLPLGLNHAASTALRGRVVVAGGYSGGPPTTGVFSLAGNRWTRLPDLPFARGAAGAATLGAVLYVVGGRAPNGLAQNMLAYDSARRRWRALVGPTPREHLAVTAAAGRLYAIGGRKAGYDTNLDVVESWRPGERRWRRETPLPEPRGGTGAAALGSTIVSVGGEAPQGTLARVYAFDVKSRRWAALPDLPTPRHGLAVVSTGNELYVIGGGPQPGLFVSDANESIRLG
jgi:non-specific serine/threonine protein kinase